MLHVKRNSSAKHKLNPPNHALLPTRGPIAHDPITGQTNMTAGIALLFVGADVSMAKSGFDSLSSEAFRLTFLTASEDLLAEQIALELLNQGQLEEGLQVVLGEVIRVTPP